MTIEKQAVRLADIYLRAFSEARYALSISGAQGIQIQDAAHAIALELVRQQSTGEKQQ